MGSSKNEETSVINNFSSISKPSNYIIYSVSNYTAPIKPQTMTAVVTATLSISPANTLRTTTGVMNSTAFSLFFSTRSHMGITTA
ncbi:hypothetical protein EYC80_003833 [Monilinia laxa]|uniref:Uncharacterized protein n=1 Tax=Monilinia laxa TaxID=61186 RepID=A0A5N6KKW2_MONLA|nr:hypothetical protein EYC80_003833 [Monilinia laxa]